MRKIDYQSYKMLNSAQLDGWACYKLVSKQEVENDGFKRYPAASTEGRDYWVHYSHHKYAGVIVTIMLQLSELPLIVNMEKSIVGAQTTPKALIMTLGG